MAKGMLILTVALLLSAMCAVEGQTVASGAAAAAGGGGGLGGGAAAAAAAAATGGLGYIRPGYGGGGYGSGYRPQYANYPVPNSYLPPGGRYSSSYLNAAKKIKSANGVGIIDNLLNHFADLDIFNNANG